MVSQSWYEFRASADSADKQTELFLYDEIGGFGISASDFVQDLQKIPSDHRLVLRVHSPGGSVLDGNAIFTALKAHPGGVTTHIDGLAASMASVIAMAGAPVKMAGNGIIMIHNVQGYAGGDSEDLRKMADVMDKISATIESTYAGKTGLSRDQIKMIMDAETWMTATEAQQLGFVDEITGDLEMAAKLDIEKLSKFHNVPMNLIDKLINARPTTKEDAPEATVEAAVSAVKAEQDKATEALLKDHQLALDAVAASLCEAHTKISELETKLTESTAQVKAATEANGTATDEISELTTKLEAAQKDVESKISDGIVKGLAEAGVEPIARDPNAPDADADTKPARNETVKGFDRVLAATRANIAPRN